MRARSRKSIVQIGEKHKVVKVVNKKLIFAELDIAHLFGKIIFRNFNGVKLPCLAKISCHEFDTKQFVINFV